MSDRINNMTIVTVNRLTASTIILTAEDLGQILARVNRWYEFHCLNFYAANLQLLTYHFY